MAIEDAEPPTIASTPSSSTHFWAIAAPMSGLFWSSAITNHSREPRRRIDVNISLPDSAELGPAREAMLEIATADKRVEIDPPPTVHLEAFAGDRVVLQLRAWVPTPQYLEALREVTEQAKLAINQQLALAGQHAEVTPASDPHSQVAGGHTPDIS